jgi:hypothetical protein
MPNVGSAIINMLYPCDPGLCRYTLGDSKPKQLSSVPGNMLHGCSFTPDGAGIMLGRTTSPHGEAEIVLTDLDLGNVRKVTTVRGAPNGLGEPEGFGLLGMTADGKRLLFEDQAQLFIANLDGSERRALMDQRPYGVSTYHSYNISPSGLRVLYTGSYSPNWLEIVDTETGRSQTFTLSLDRMALMLIDDTHLLIERFGPPYNPEGSNPTTKSKYSLGYEIVPIAGASLGDPVVLFTDEGSVERYPISNVAGDWLLIEDFYRINDNGTVAPIEQLWLLNLKTGERQPISLPLYNHYFGVAIRVAP